MRATEILMPRFYFNLASKDADIPDNSGKELDTLHMFRAQRRAIGRKSSLPLAGSGKLARVGAWRQLCPCDTNTLTNTRDGGRFAQVALRSCGLLKMASRFGDLPDLCTFECRARGVSYRPRLPALACQP